MIIASSSLTTTHATMSASITSSSSSSAPISEAGLAYSYTSSGQGARPNAGYGSGVTRYVVKTSDVIEDLRITVAPESAPSNVIWHTERYLTPNQIILHLIHSPTRTILWSVHRPINTRRQGWYIRLKSPQFPEGMHIPLKPISRTSPYFVEEGCLSFRCRTNAINSSLPPPSLRHGYSDSASSSSSSSVHSYPPTPPAMSPTTNPISLRSASEDLLGLSTVTSQTTGVPQGRGIVPASLLGPVDSTPSSSTALSSPVAESTADLISLTSPAQSQSTGKPTITLTRPQSQPAPQNSNGLGQRRAAAPPALQLPSEITEFILAPFTAAAALYPASQRPQLALPAAQGPTSTLSSLFSKALNLISSQTATATSGTSFVLTRIPPPPMFAKGQSVSPPPPYTTSTSSPPSTPSKRSNPESPTTPTASSYAASSAGPSSAAPIVSHHQQWQARQQQTAISSSSLQAPLPQPLLTLTDTTPYLTLHASSGVLEVREDEVRAVGVEKAFWVCVALVYWGYMGDREGWVWAGEE